MNSLKLEDLGRLKNRISTWDITKFPKRKADISIKKDELFKGSSEISIWVKEQLIRTDNSVHSFKVGLPHHRDGREDIAIYYKNKTCCEGKAFFCGYPELRPIVVEWLNKM